MRTARCATLALAGALLAGCSAPSGSDASGTAAGGSSTPHVLRYAMDLDVPGLNPHLVTVASLGYLSQMTMAYLVRYGKRDEPIPELVTEVPSQQNGDISKDGLSITWHLRKGVRWSDGAPFDADDVVFSTQTVLNPKNNEVGRDGWDQIARVEEPSKYTVVFHMKKPLATFLPTFFGSAGANPCVLPKHILGSLPTINQAPYNSLPVGIGPFRYTKWNRGDSVEMEANPYYWRGKPKLQKVIYRIIPDRNTLLTQVQSGAVDLWPTVPPALAPRVQNIAGFRTFTRPSYIYDHLDFNNSRPVGADPVVRQALRYAVDRKRLLEQVSHGFGLLQESVVPKADPTFVNIPLVPYDPAKAKAMLDADGWKMGPDGVRSKNGVRLVFDFAVASGSPDQDTRIELIRSWWKPLGVGLNVKHYANGFLFAPYSEGGILYTGKFDLIAFAWQSAPGGNPNNQYASDQIPPRGQDMPHYRNPAVDAAFETYKHSFDAQARAKASRFFQEQIARDVPVIVLDSRVDTFVESRALKGYDPNNSTAFDDMLNVDI